MKKPVQTEFPQTALRPPSQVMRLERMGSFFPTRLSFMRTLIRRLHKENAEVTRPVWEINDQGFGRAVYSVNLGGHTYSLIIFATELDPANRTDRVIAEAWDVTFNLFDGVPTTADLDRLQNHTPKQEAGRFSENELILSRANKSVRLFDHVVESLSQGQQPDAEMVREIGYLMRTTAVYGNGKFGISDRHRISDRAAMAGSFQAELLAVWLIRGFTHDLVEHVAQVRDPQKFVPLTDETKRALGIGNSTGLGMAPFLVSHPILINNWMVARETALARVRTVEPSKADFERAAVLIARVKKHLLQWNVADERQMKRIVKLRDEFDQISANLPATWDDWISASEAYSLECQELIVALLLEIYPGLVDGLDECMLSLEMPKLDPRMSLAKLNELANKNFDWALEIDFEDKAQTHQFWYVSEEKLEPRLGERHTEEGAELETPLDIARQVQALSKDLEALDQKQSVAEFLLKYPQHRLAVRRVQTSEKYPYGEIHDNLIGEKCLPIDMLRAKLSFFGASKFDPKSDRWTRITMFQGAPLFDEISKPDHDDWWLPVV